MAASPLYVLILAGGSGERFWPLSRKARPKQLLSLFSKETLLEATLRRLEGLVPPEQILILTNADQETAVRALCPELPPQNIVAEPAKRDTAAAIALGVGWIARHAPTGTMVVLPADHLIQDVAGFQQTLRTAVSAAEETGELVTIGIKPTWACPGFGYIETGARASTASQPGGPAVFEVVRFREKPSAELAETFLAQGNFRWNAGMFIWSVRSILSAFNRYVPALGEFINQIHRSPNLAQTLRETFPALPKISIDYAVLEKASRVLMVESGFDWDDVGSWTAAAKYFPGDAAGNVGNATVQAVDSGGNIVYSTDGTVIGLIGVQDLIIVHTGDALLICHRHEAEKIKQLVSQVPPELQ
ncbi:MAG: mannose-phosphate guanylyltransferase [Chthoniobacter sp.]|jgi:mannose-1-phosphate guanylyltransferase|nr:mannose-phosphate guanylyltransferase [Chthoniobacter sp.]